MQVISAPGRGVADAHLVLVRSCPCQWLHVEVVVVQYAMFFAEYFGKLFYIQPYSMYIIAFNISTSIYFVPFVICRLVGILRLLPWAFLNGSTAAETGVVERVGA